MQILLHGAHIFATICEINTNYAYTFTHVLRIDTFMCCYTYLHKFVKSTAEMRCTAHKRKIDRKRDAHVYANLAKQ